MCIVILLRKMKVGKNNNNYKLFMRSKIYQVNIYIFFTYNSYIYRVV